MSLVLVITNAGRAALIDPANGGTRAVRIASVGVSGTAIVASPTTAALPGEVKRIATISGDAVGPDVMHMVVRDESMDVVTVRSIALYLGDGTLFAAYGQPDPIIQKAAGSLMLLAIDVTLQDVAAGNITFGATSFLNPPATTERAGVVELATDAEAEAATDPLRALSPANIGAILSAARILAKIMTVDGAGSGLDADLLDGRHGSEFAQLAGATFTGAVNTRDLTVTRGDGTGIIYLNGAQTRYLFFDGAQYQLAAGQLLIGGATAWNAGNDGAGSGLDADLLDGQEGSWYANIAARLGYTPLDAATYTAAGVLAKLLSVDGAGSGLDADLLDGQHGAWYTDIAARLGFTPLNAASYTAASVIAKLLTVDGAGSGLDADLLDGLDSAAFAKLTGAAFTGPVTTRDLTVTRGDGTGIIYLNGAQTRYLFFDGTQYQLAAGQLLIAGATAWNAGNDGAGSGLDADLLDGLDSAAFAKLIGAAFTGPVTTRDLTVTRGDGTGIIYLNGAQTRHLFYDGTQYQLAAAQLLIAGSLAWNAANDGAGSGLDADLLDGQDGSWYANIAARLGYTPLDAATYTAAVVLAKLLTVDGAGSGLDADLLDGQHGAWYADIAARLGYTPLNAANYTLADILAKLATATGLAIGNASGPRAAPTAVTLDQTYGNGSGKADRLKFYLYRSAIEAYGFGVNDRSAVEYHSGRFDGADSAGHEWFINEVRRMQLTAAGLKRDSAVVWDALNDGAGSGLDADMVDGRHASDFVLANDNTRFGSNANGYWERRPNGVIEQWGTTGGRTTEGTVTIEFPIAFTDENSINVQAVGANTGANNRYDMMVQRVSRNATGVVLMLQYSANQNSASVLDAVDWRAIGR